MRARIRRSICLVAAAVALAVLGAGCKPGKAAPAGGSKRPAAPVLVATVAKTLYVTPVFYLYMDRLQTWVRTRAATPESAPVGVAARE
jgi:hypothetical protein